MKKVLFKKQSKNSFVASVEAELIDTLASGGGTICFCSSDDLETEHFRGLFINKYTDSPNEIAKNIHLLASEKNEIDENGLPIIVEVLHDDEFDLTSMQCKAYYAVYK